MNANERQLGRRAIAAALVGCVLLCVFPRGLVVAFAAGHLVAQIEVLVTYVWWKRKALASNDEDLRAAARAKLTEDEWEAITKKGPQ